MATRVIITENQYQRLFENIHSEVIGNHNNRYEFELDFSGNNDNRQSNDKNFLDWLFINGKIGQLPSSEMTIFEINDKITTEYEGQLDDFKQECEDFVPYVMQMARHQGINNDEIVDGEYAKYATEEHWWVDLDEFESHVINQRLYQDLSFLVFKEYCDNFDADSLTFNDRGLVYVEREILVPALLDKFAKAPKERKDFFNILNAQYKNGIGDCWTYQPGNGEIQNYHSDYQSNTNSLIIKAWVDPKDVLWKASMYLHREFPEEKELRLCSDAPIEIFEIFVSDIQGNPKLNLNGQTILFKA